MPENVKKSGFSLVEVMISASVAMLVSAVVLTSFIWAAKQTSLCMKRGWSQHAAMATSVKIAAYIRNASEIYAIDEVDGTWVKLRFPDGGIGELTYKNPETEQRDGNLRLRKWDSNNKKVLDEKIITSGMMAVPNLNGDGFSEHVFSGVVGGSNLKVSYWISAPNSKGSRSANDGRYAVSVRFSASMRNNPALAGS